MGKASRKTKGKDEGASRRDELLQLISTYFEEVGPREFSFRAAAKVAGISTIDLTDLSVQADRSLLH